VLDEPTNHLDIPSAEVLEDALADFEGTVLVISHDRYFLDRIATRIVELDEGGMHNYPGCYSDYWAQKAPRTP
jgi:ATPase subunit of ABC transporter with duplicated ATPase domains